LDTGVSPDKVVKTHCCFCGQQCGIQLLVKENQVIGFEPWMEFPFNEGKLCPKGIKRYLQDAHPDRLLHAYERDPSASGGFKPIAYEAAIRRVASEIERLQYQHGRQAFACLSGASLTIEKAYLMGKFARVCLQTPYIDYNGRLCMVSAAAANKKAFGIDRAANPWSDILRAEVVWISGANVAECAPITTDYVGQAREHGAKLIVVDPRITPLGRTCDLFLPIKPGRDVALFNGILHLMIEHDWLDHAFILLQPTGVAAGQSFRQPHTRQAGVLRRHRLLSERERPPRGYHPAWPAARRGRGHRDHGRGPRHQSFPSGTQTRRIGPLVDHCPEPFVEVHPQLAAKLDLADGDWATVESRRGTCTLKAHVVKTIRPDTVFIPCHWAGEQSANRLTIAAQDPISKIPEYKVCAVRLKKANHQ